MACMAISQAVGMEMGASYGEGQESLSSMGMYSIDDPTRLQEQTVLSYSLDEQILDEPILVQGRDMPYVDDITQDLAIDLEAGCWGGDWDSIIETGPG